MKDAMGQEALTQPAAIRAYRLDLLRRYTGAIFLLAGAIKLLMPVQGQTFGEVMATLHVPYPALAGIMVPLLEIVGGIALRQRRGIKLFAPLLAINMVFAIALIGVPGLLGHKVTITQYYGPPHEIGSEFWRLPLEIGLLVALLIVFSNEFRSDS